MPSEPRWLEPADIIEFNRLIVESTGETHRLLDMGRLEGALHRPRNLYLYEGRRDVVALATSLLFGIALDHPFEQGNKRTGFEAVIEFSRINGYDVRIPDAPNIAEAIVAVITRQADADWFEQLVRPFFVLWAGDQP